MNMKSELIYQLTNNRPPLLPCFPKHRWCRPKSGFFVCWHRLLSKTLDEAVKTSYSEGNRPVISDQETKTAQITSRSPDSQEIHRKSPVQCSDRSVQRPCAVPFTNLYRSQRVMGICFDWKSLPICCDSIWFQLLLPFWWH